MSRVRHSIETVAYGISVLNTTNLRIYVTLCCVVWTTICYTTSNWIPSDSFLMFLAALSGLDLGTFWVKRSSAWPPSVTNGSTATTDVQEIQKG